MESKTITSIQVLESKLLLRKLIKGKPENSYESLISIFLNSNYTDLENLELVPNTKSYQGIFDMTPNIFQFLISSQYFSRQTEDLLHIKENLLNSLYENIVEEKVNAYKLYSKKITKHLSEVDKEKLADEFQDVRDLMNGKNVEEIKYEANTDTEEVIRLVKREVIVMARRRKVLFDKVNARNERLKPFINFMSSVLPSSELKSEDIDIKDLTFETRISKVWRTYLTQKQESSCDDLISVVPSFNEEKASVQEYVICEVCNDGDHEEGNLIVYCSSCQITVHQNCYGIQYLPDDDWTCNVCLAFPKESIGSVECCLCSVEGGAMKLSSLRRGSLFFKKILKLRNGGILFNKNESLLRSKPNLLDSSNALRKKSCESSLLQSADAFEKKEELKIQFKEDKARKIEKLKINQLTNSEMYILYKKDIIKKANDFAWVHVSCALWNPSISTQDYFYKEDFRNIDTIDLEKFNETCFVCNKSGYGPCIKCENEHCKLVFHVECARVNKYYLEYHLSEDENKYFIYCQLHRPLKFLKVLELRNQKKKEEIYKYFSFLEKNITINPKVRVKPSPSAINMNNSNTQKQSLMLNKKRRVEIPKPKELNNFQSSKIISKLRDLLNKINNLTINLSRRNDTKFYKVQKSEILVDLNYGDVFDLKVFPWYLVRWSGITPIQAYKHFLSLCPNVQNLNSLLHSTKSNLAENQSLLTSIEEDEDTNNYCYCRQRIKPNIFMVSCSGDENCAYNGWFHQDCVKELKNRTKAELQDPGYIFTCRNCLDKGSTIGPKEPIIVEQSNVLIDVNFQLDLQ